MDLDFGSALVALQHVPNGVAWAAAGAAVAKVADFFIAGRSGHVRLVEATYKAVTAQQEMLRKGYADQVESLIAQVRELDERLTVMRTELASAEEKLVHSDRRVSELEGEIAELRRSSKP